MTKAELVSEISLSTGYDRKTVQVIAESMIKEIKAGMAKGKNVYLRGFGSFVVKPRKEKVARNITKRTSVYVPAHCVPSFRPAKEFNEAVYGVKLPKKQDKPKD